MIVTSYKTKAIKAGDSLLRILDDSLPALGEKEVIVVTSKIISICEGSIIKNDGAVDKHDIIKHEADYYLDTPLSQTYGLTITMKNGKLVANAGIDESNGNGYFILWPRNLYRSAATIWRYLRKKFGLAHLGIIISDSHNIQLQWGTRGRALAWCGLEPLKDYIGTPDIFGKKLRMTKASIVDGLAAASVAVMGEGNEQTPLAVIKDVSFVTFVSYPPTKKEIESLTIDPKDDIYAPLLTSVQWKKR